MKNIYLCLLFFVFTNCSNNQYPIRIYQKYNSKKSIINQDVIFFSQEKSKELFRSAKYKEDFFHLAPHFESQRYLSTCGPASLKIVLAALYSYADKEFLIAEDRSNNAKLNHVNADYKIMTEENIFNFMNKVKDEDILHNGDYSNYKIISRRQKNSNGKFNGGTGAEHLAQIAKTHDGIDATYILFQEKVPLHERINQFKEDLKNTLNNPEKYMILYFTQSIQQNATSFGGHFSPVAAYNEQEDKVLILDVASSINSWYWASVYDIVLAMTNNFDDGYRGYLTVFLKKT